MDVTQRRAEIFITSDLSVRFTVHDHHTSQVPDTAWKTFRDGYRHAHGTDAAESLAEYVDGESWSWDTTYSDGTVIIGDADGPLALEAWADGPEGCRIVFWDHGNLYDTGLRVWLGETAIIAGLLREKKASEAPAW